MSKTIDDMAKEFVEIEDLRRFSEAQHKTINELSKRIRDLEDEKQHLMSLLETTSGNIETIPIPEIKNEELICLDQLQRLKEVSNERQLTLEETRKVEIYAKVLNLSRGNNKKLENPLERKDVGELLKLVEGGLKDE